MAVGIKVGVEDGVIVGTDVGEPLQTEMRNVPIKMIIQRRAIYFVLCVRRSAR